jgi:RNA polymerase sigma factor (sigma-70 family)
VKRGQAGGDALGFRRTWSGWTRAEVGSERGGTSVFRLVPACADDPEMAGQILDLLGQSGVSVNSTYDELDVAEGGEADDESLEREDNDLLAAYLKQVRRTQILTREEEFAYFARIDAAIDGGQGSQALRLRNEVVQRNLRLVVSLARRYLNRGLPLGDLIQEGNIGLLKAVDKFDLRRGYKLSTYAFYWIRQSIVRALCKHGRTISIPSHLFEKLNRIAAAQGDQQRREILRWRQLLTRRRNRFALGWVFFRAPKAFDQVADREHKLRRRAHQPRVRQAAGHDAVANHIAVSAQDAQRIYVLVKHPRTCGQHWRRVFV